MNRIQFFPSEELKNCLANEAQKGGVTVSQLVVDILNNYYGLQNGLSVSELTEIVLREIEEYVANPKDLVFDLNKASGTYRTISMTIQDKPKAVKASIGRSFAAKIGKPPFEHVKKWMNLNGRPHLSANNASMYIIETDKEKFQRERICKEKA